MAIEYIKRMVDNPHPIYRKYYDYWNFLLQSYEGGIDYSQSSLEKSQNLNTGVQVLVGGKELTDKRSVNLFQHPKERSEDYNARVKMSYYYNFCSPILDIYTNHLFNKPVIEKFDGINETALKAREMDIDGKGSSISEFRKEVADMTQLYGHMFIVCDNPKVNQPIITLQDKINTKMFPYFCTYQPQDVINWSVDSFGQCNWVLLREVADINATAESFDEKVQMLFNYRLLTKTGWMLVDSKYELLDEGFYNIGKVPMVCSYNKQSKKAKSFLGISEIADIAFIARDVYNACSELRQILRDQTFAFLALQGTADEYSEVSVGTSKGLLYPEGRNAPIYVSPASQNAEVYFSHIDRQVSKMFQLAKLEGGSAEFKGQSAVEQSGVSKAWDFNQTNAALSRKAQNLEDAEEKLWQIFAKQDGNEFQGSIQYTEEFSVKDLNSELDEAEKLIKLNLGKMFTKEIKMAIVKRKFPRIDEKDLSQIESEIDAEPATSNSTEGNPVIRNRFPFLFKNQNANSGGKQGGV